MVRCLFFEQETRISKFHRVENILTGVSEQNKVLYSCPDYLILPDMKWDLKTVSSLYLVALVQNRSIRSLRDLNCSHLDLLKSIRREASRIVKERWGLGIGSLRMYIHYQPSYCVSRFYFEFNTLDDFLL